ncbi:hypothetical protein OUY22_13915 [Nonomuraea sp. MCN248]|uniref:PE domain-containing protein n=1 Tax=Nonomuraea corallina TaxID=2989783 RepID=A0ABT4SBD6_9ACTN|nr:hypothetical protein [Nonomuraea corallina]MDA0634516.1 hypothetical protein [Nonomuraea corallina]
MLREAMAKAALADRMERYARQLAIVFEGVPTNQEASNLTWKGPAADDFTARANRLKQETRELEQACVATARNLRRRADQLREAAANSPDAW